MSLLAATKIEDITANQILDVAENDPERLFSKGAEDQVKKEYRQLAKRWHSDHNPDPRAKDVMQRLSLLYDKANEKIKLKQWQEPHLFRFQDLSGKKYQVNYLKKSPFDLGDMYIAKTTVTFVLKKDDRDLFENAKNTITHFSYPNKDMQEKLVNVLPQIVGSFETSDSLVMILKKDPDDILMSDVITHEKGKIEPVHAAWMISRLHNLSCYLEWSELTHNAITPENCFVSPKDHNVSLLGGWWYAAREGEKLKALPASTVKMVSPTLFDRPIASKKVDLSLIRATGREILGDATGMSFIGSKDIPEAMTSWVNGPSSGDARQDYKIWSENVLTNSFGARRFVEMKLSPNDIYKL